jgi:hypothetical protein
MLNAVADSVVRDGSGVPIRAGRSVVGDRDDIVRAGARRMLAEAQQAQMEAYCARFADERDENGRRLVVRNGYHGDHLRTRGGGARAAGR